MSSGSEPIGQFESRKRDHIRLALDPQNEAVGGSQLDRIELIHDAMPELDFTDIDIHSQRFGQATATPFFVSSMTAGHHDAVNINQVLIQACAEQGWAMGVGSQRRELFDPAAAEEWQAIRAIANNVELYGNLGLSQLIKTPIADIQRLVDSLQATAMIIHCNALQECMQPEGTPQFRGSFAALEQLCNTLTVPVIVKETGCGFAKHTLEKLQQLPVAAVDVSGFGGTHWGRIEGQRAEQQSINAKAAQTFQHWGVATVDSVLFAQQIQADYDVWASGGVRNGLDAAKLLALGASNIGFAKPMLHAALEGVDNVVNTMQSLEYELKVAMFCTNSKNLASLRENKYVIK